MLPTQQPETLSAVSLLPTAVRDELNTDILQIESYHDLMFSCPSSVASNLKWTDDTYKALAKEIQSPLASLYGRMPLKPFLDCVSACLPYVAKSLRKYHLHLVTKKGEVKGLAVRRAVPVRPSDILRSLADWPTENYDLEYSPCNLTVVFKNSLIVARAPILSVRVLLKNGWGLQASPNVLRPDAPVNSSGFCTWIVPNWDLALFKIKTLLDDRR
jgi:hypothetical protein